MAHTTVEARAANRRRRTRLIVIVAIATAAVLASVVLGAVGSLVA